MWPVGLSTSNSSIWERPFQTLRVTEVPSKSTQVLEPVMGLTSRFRGIFHEPSSKSKSCCPSCFSLVAGGAGFESVCETAVDELAPKIKIPSQKHDCMRLNICIVPPHPTIDNEHSLAPNRSLPSAPPAPRLQ